MDAGPVLAHLSDAERAWLAEHPKATFCLRAVDLLDRSRVLLIERT